MISLRPRVAVGGLAVLSIAFVLISAAAWAEDVTTFEITLKNHAFNPAVLKVPSGKPFRLRVVNMDPTPAEFECRDMKIEKVVAGNAEIAVRVKPLQPGTYEFVDEYHQDTTKGHIVAE